MNKCLFNYLKIVVKRHIKIITVVIYRLKCLFIPERNCTIIILHLIIVVGPGLVCAVEFSILAVVVGLVEL